MWIVRVALDRPYTFVVLALLILILSSAGYTCDPCRHLSQYQYPGHRRRLVVYRPQPRGIRGPDHQCLRTCSDHAGRQHSAH